MKINWRVKLGLILIVLSLIFYIIQYFIFHELHEQLLYFGIDLAFIPLEVLVVVLLVERAINEKEKQLMMEKVNMVISAFFSEVGTHLLQEISRFDPQNEEIKNKLMVTGSWTSNDFSKVAKEIKNIHNQLDIKGDDNRSVELLKDIKIFLVNQREFLLRLLENPNLMEHDTFTDLLWAVFHLTEELDKRKDLEHLPQSDYAHLKLDTERAYNLLIFEWLQYMDHLMNHYPYLFSLALRINPFDPNAKAEIQG
jgi:hypothetical protein